MEWDPVCILTSTDDVWRMAAEGIKEQMEADGKTVHFFTTMVTQHGHVVYPEIIAKLYKVVERMKNSCRVIFTTTPETEFRNMLMGAKIHDMLGGDWIFVGIDMGTVPATFIAEFNDPEELYDGFINLKLTTYNHPDKEAFNQKIIDYLQDPIFDGYDHLPANATTDKVDYMFASKCQLNIL